MRNRGTEQEISQSGQQFIEIDNPVRPTGLDTLTNVERVEVLPYHNMGLYKWDELGIPNQLRDVQPPSEEDMQQARDILGAV